MRKSATAATLQTVVPATRSTGAAGAIVPSGPRDHG